jgi:hypothetical protein
MNKTYYLMSPDYFKKIKKMPNFDKNYNKTYKQYILENVKEIQNRPNVLYLINMSKNSNKALEILTKFNIKYSHNYC